jgi:hypothetical protein
MTMLRRHEGEDSDDDGDAIVLRVARCIAVAFCPR